jgi:hypothetical protein
MTKVTVYYPNGNIIEKEFTHYDLACKFCDNILFEIGIVIKVEVVK